MPINSAGCLCFYFIHICYIGGDSVLTKSKEAMRRICVVHENR